MSLEKYRRKRKFTQTPEPEGSKQKNVGPLSFVVQKHAASRLHYDFRLELNGVLKSWAVPRGPSLNPRDRRLAVMVEDHPMEYAGFEGIIPKGNYGAGTVMVWDKGVYSPIAFVDRKQAEVILSEQLEKGHLTFVLLGEKLRGEFALVRSKKGDENAWFLFKARDEYSSGKDILIQDTSVLSGRSMERIESEAVGKKEVWFSKPKSLDLSDAAKGKMPHHVKPMLAYSSKDAFDDEEWLFEIKYDGYRAIAEVAAGKVLLYSRNGISFNEKYSLVVDSLRKFPGDVVLDGEIAVVDSSGRPHFQWLQEYPDEKRGELVYYVFDVLYYDGRDLTSLQLLRRKELLREILPPLPGLMYADHIMGSGVAMFAQTQRLGVEGIMAKNGKSAYKPGERSSEWLKIKLQKRQEVVIAGFTKPKGGRKYFGALIGGIYKDKKLTYAGHIGGGFDDKKLEYIYRQLTPLIQKECPFKIIPETNTPVTWIEPEPVAEVAFSDWTKDGVMRHPVFLGLKDTGITGTTSTTSTTGNVEGNYFIADTVAKDSKAMRVGKRDLVFTNLSKVFWPEEKYTKGDLIEYYKGIAPLILPYLKDRPESLLRYPDGITGESFYQKDAGKLHVDWIEKVVVHSESGGKDVSYLLCQNEASLLYLINLGCIDLNPWSSRVGSLDNPDYLIIDLDPEEADFSLVVKAALGVREVLEKLDIESFVKTSGASGMHVYIPLGAKYSYEQCRRFAELLCIEVHKKIPEVTSLTRDPKKRRGLVYLDYLQNIRGQTLASVYSVRARPGATVSTPLLWSEVDKKLHPSLFTMRNIMRRVQRRGDLFKGVLGRGIEIGRVLERMSGVMLE
jgi:bifunctional non-homologous end joining protein LigD